MKQKPLIHLPVAAIALAVCVMGPFPSEAIRAEMSASELRDVDKFSFRKFVVGQLASGKLDGIEKELCDEGKNEGISPAGGRMLSYKAMCAGSSFRNDLTSGGSGTGREVRQNIAQRPLIDILFENMPLALAGANIVTNLQGGDWPIPRWGRSTTRPLETGETSSATELTPSTDMLTMTAHRIPAFIDVTHKFLYQTRGTEGLLRNYLAMELAARWERQAIAGDGTGSNILGILNTPGIGDVAGGANGLAPTWAHIKGLESAVTTANDIGRRYLTNSAVRRKLKDTLKNPSGSEAYIWGDNLEASLNGYPALVSNLVPSDPTKGTAEDECSAILHGDFRDLILAQWGGVQFLVDPHTFDTTGIVRINSALFVDSAIKRVESFAAMKDALTA